MHGPRSLGTEHVARETRTSTGHIRPASVLVTHVRNGELLRSGEQQRLEERLPRRVVDDDVLTIEAAPRRPQQPMTSNADARAARPS
jgi:hypothetical protein